MQTIHRYHAQQSDGYRFTFSSNPNLGQGWTYDGIAFKVPIIGNVRVHQFHYDQSSTYGGWRFHFSKDMKPQSEGWTYDGDAFQAFKMQLEGTVPVYQFHAVQSDGWRFHFSTSHLPASQGWTHDGVAFYAFPGEVQ